MTTARYVEPDHFRDPRHMGSSFHEIRMTLGVMGHGTPEGRAAISGRVGE